MTDITNMSGNTVNEHCLNSVMRLSQTRQVTAAEDIYDSRGTKLWAKDAAITPELQQRLLRRKLRKPFEATLRVAEGVNADAIVAEAKRLYESMPAVACLIGAHQAEVLETLSLVRLDPAATLLLTSAAENGTGLSHAVLVALIAVSIGSHAGHSGTDQMTLALAGLLHDIGELYIKPEYLHSSRRLSPEEWKHVAVHPRVGEVVLDGLACYPKAVTQAVAEHHERFDGNGYPRQIPGGRISPAGQILGVAEILSGILAREGNALARACLALKLVPGEHAHELVSVIATIGQHSAHGARGYVEGSLAEALHQTAHIAGSLDAAIDECTWILEQAQTLSAQGQDLALRFQYRLRTLQQALRATGVQQCADGRIVDTLHVEDEGIALELEMVGREIGWRLRDMARELTLRINDLPTDPRPAFARLLSLLDGRQ